MSQYTPCDANDIPYGYCHCGCGQKTRIAPQTSAEKGWIRGEPVRYLSGHNGKIRNANEHFWSRVDIGNTDECWDWQGCASSGGYGSTTLYGEKELTHRAAWRLANGQDIPGELLVRHKCDRPICCNPAHLELGTHANNAADREERGRGNQIYGEKHFRARLSETEVLEIISLLASGETYGELSARYSVSRGCIRAIDIRETWKHLR